MQKRQIFDAGYLYVLSTTHNIIDPFKYLYNIDLVRLTSIKNHQLLNPGFQEISSGNRPMLPTTPAPQQRMYMQPISAPISLLEKWNMR